MLPHLAALGAVVVLAAHLGAQAPKVGANKGPGALDAIKGVIGQRADQLNAAKKMTQLRDKAPGAVVSGLQTAVKPESTAIDFPREWKRIVEGRAKVAGHRLTAKETAVLKALDLPLTVDFSKTRFREVLSYLSDKTREAIVVAEGTLEEADIDYDDPVSLKISKPVPMRSILRKVLRDRGLTYVVHDGTIQVVTAERARGMMVMRVHDVMDICGPRPPDERLTWPTNRNAMHLKRTIENMIEPDLWDVNGGPAALHYWWATVSFTIRAPAELHLRLGAAGFAPGAR